MVAADGCDIVLFLPNGGVGYRIRNSAAGRPMLDNQRTVAIIESRYSHCEYPRPEHKEG
jgi:hypothetical protein